LPGARMPGFFFFVNTIIVFINISVIECEV